MTEHVLLIGMMGSGKTSVGRRVAELLGRSFRDSDAEIEAATGRTVREIFETDGEIAFRREEATVLRAALEDDEPAVIAVAGGAVLDAENRRLIVEHGAPTVWLHAALGVLASRASTGDHRPLLGDEPLAALERLYPEREPIYRDLATLVVDVTDATPDDVAAQIAERVLA